MSVPDHVFRYQKVDSRLAELVTERRVYLASRTQFNDPYDCRFVVSAECSFETFARKAGDTNDPLHHLLIRRYRHAPLKKRIAFGYRDKHHIFSSEAPLSRFNAFVDTTGLFCVSGNKKSLLMWSHYANQHRGVCVEFSTKVPGALRHLLPVKYSEKIPVYRIFEADLTKMTTDALCVKSNEWKYEEEWRLIAAKLAKTKLNLQRGSISKVILGARIEDHEKRMVFDMVRESGDPIIIEQARIIPDRFELEFVPF